jgi:hypothetical protein
MWQWWELMPLYTMVNTVNPERNLSWNGLSVEGEQEGKLRKLYFLFY